MKKQKMMSQAEFIKEFNNSYRPPFNDVLFERNDDDIIDEVSKVLEYEVKPVIGKYVHQHEVLYNAFYNAFTDFATDPIIKMSGKV